MLKCYIITDDEHTRDSISNYFDKLPNMHLIGSSSNPLIALDDIKKGNKPNIVFLDINLFDLSIMDVADLLPPDIGVIFVTEHTHYALRAFEINAIGFILKPVTFEMFVKALNKLNIMLEKLQSINQMTQEKLFIKTGAKNKIVQLNIKDIFYIQALDHYVNVHTQNESYIIYTSMYVMEEKLSKTIFSRIHKSFIVNVDLIKSIEDNQVFLINGIKISFGGDVYKRPFFEKIHLKTIKKLSIY